MLVLSRETDQTIEINVPGYEPIVIVIAGVQGRRVKLGVDAPKEFKILRSELKRAAKLVTEQQPKPKPIVDMPSVFGGVRVAG